MNSERTKVFISYSHRDEPWLQRLHVHLGPSIRSSSLDVWDDTKLAPGSRWQDEIRQALAAAKVAVLLVSANFMDSNYIAGTELPSLLEAAENDGAIILPVILSPSAFKRTPELFKFQAVNDVDNGLVDLPLGRQEAVFDKVAQAVELAIGRHESQARLMEMTATLDGHQQVIAEQARRIEVQQERINQLVRYMLSASIFRHLCGLTVLKDYKYWHSAPMSREMYFLRDIGFIQPRPPNGGFLDFSDQLNGRNLVDLVEPTPVGWWCVQLRRNEIPQDWLEAGRRDNLRVDQMDALNR